jgi:hypothetical protein
MALMAEAGAQADFGQRQVITRQQSLSALDAKLDQVLVWGCSGRAFELTREMKAAHSRDLGQFSEF